MAAHERVAFLWAELSIRGSSLANSRDVLRRNSSRRSWQSGTTMQSCILVGAPERTPAPESAAREILQRRQVVQGRLALPPGLHAHPERTFEVPCWLYHRPRLRALADTLLRRVAQPARPSSALRDTSAGNSSARPCRFCRFRLIAPPARAPPVPPEGGHAVLLPRADKTVTGMAGRASPRCALRSSAGDQAARRSTAI